MKKTNNYPLILVFYLDAELMSNPQIIKPFADSVNDAFAKRKANAMAFFLPTKGEERVECINPIMVKESDMAKINKMVEDIKLNFSIGADINLPDEEIIIGEKPCVCGNNPNGNCKCD